MRAIVVFSGGMDSTVALVKAINNFGADNVQAVSFNYNSKHNDQEYLRAQRTAKKYGIKHQRVDLTVLSQYLKSNLLKDGGEIPEGHYAESNMKKTVVPFRNGIMLSVACGIAESVGAKYLVIGNHAGDHAIYPDCRGTFINAMNEAMAYGTYSEVNIISPFCTFRKEDIAAVGDNLKVDWNDTYSCYKGGETHCGVCSTCFERREAFHIAEVEDPTEYLDKRTFEEIQKDYTERLDNDV